MTEARMSIDYIDLSDLPRPHTGWEGFDPRAIGLDDNGRALAEALGGKADAAAGPITISPSRSAEPVSLAAGGIGAEALKRAAAHRAAGTYSKL